MKNKKLLLFLCAASLPAFALVVLLNPFVSQKEAQATSGTLTISSSSTANTGSTFATQFIDAGNTSYFLDPAATGTSLAIAGKAGIGATSPLSRLHAATDTTNLTGKAVLIVDQLESQDIFTASASGTTKFVIDNSGNVGIGKTPTSVLDVSGTVNATVFGTSTEKKSAGCSTASCTATAACTTSPQKYVIFGMKSVTAANCDTNPNNCTSHCTPGSASCAATSTGSAASVFVFCAKMN